MARQALGRKKRNRIEAKVGMKIEAAFVDSVWGRGWVEVFATKKDSFLLNLKTGDFTQLALSGKPVTTKPLWRKVGCCA